MVMLMFVRPDCHFCKSAQKLAEKELGGKSYFAVDVSNKTTNAMFRKFMKKHKLSHHTTLPAIFSEKDFIGGSTELEHYFSGNAWTKSR